MCQVLYDVRGILEKNRDTFRDDILNMLKDSRWQIIHFISDILNNAVDPLIRSFSSLSWDQWCIYCKLYFSYWKKLVTVYNKVSFVYISKCIS